MLTVRVTFVSNVKINYMAAKVTDILQVILQPQLENVLSFSVPGVDEAALEQESSSEDLRPELLPRLRLALSGTNTLAEVDLATDTDSDFS